VLGALVITLALSSPTSAQPAAPATNGPSLAGFAAVDTAAMTRQFHRLQSVAGAHAEGAGGTYFDETTGQLVVRVVSNTGGERVRAAVNTLARQTGDVQVRFESTNTPIKRLRDAAASLDASHAWAGERAGLVNQVWLDELALQIVIDASGGAAELAAAAEKATGFKAEVTISDGAVPLSRRNDTAPFYGGLAIWNEHTMGSVTFDPATYRADCTTGFRMTRGGSNSNWVTTAGHCGPNETWFWHPGGYMARVSSNYYSLGTDIAMLAPLNGAYFSRQSWFGDRNTFTANPVTGKNTTWPAVGSGVYVSGANGGLVYGRVTGTNVTCSVMPGFSMVRIDTQSGHANDGSNLQGDSGSPVTRWNTATATPTNDLVAVGSLSCGNQFDTSWFTPIHLIESATDSVVVVGGT
jgi:hypothetical protein